MKLVQFKEYCSEKRVKTGGFISAELDLKYEKEALEYCKKHLKPHKKALNQGPTLVRESLIRTYSD